MKHALLLIDIQMDYFAGGLMELAEAPESILAAHEALTYFRKQNALVVHVKQESPAEVGFLIKGTPGSDIHPKVAPEENEIVIRKQTPNAFFQTGLLDTLKEHGVDTVTVIGYMANMCVDSTIRAAKEHGFKVYFIPEAISASVINSTSGKEVKDVYLTSLGQAFGTPISMDALETIYSESVIGV